MNLSLEIGIYFTLISQNQISKICKKVRLKLDALARIAPCMVLKKTKTIMEAFIISHFAYFP